MLNPMGGHPNWPCQIMSDVACLMGVLTPDDFTTSELDTWMSHALEEARSRVMATFLSVPSSSIGTE